MSNTLLDIGPLTEDVKIRGAVVTVSALSALDIFRILVRFPEVRSLFNGGETSSWTVDQLLLTVPNAVYAALAICTGTEDDAEAEEVASKLSVAYQTKLLAAVLRLTFPEGVGPFATEFRQMLDKLSVETEDLQTQLQGVSLASLQMDIPPQPKRGRSHRVN